MKPRRLVFSALIVLTVCTRAFAADFNGTWTAAIETQMGMQNYTYTFKVTGEKLTGRAKSQYGDTELTEGEAKGDEITFVENLKSESMPWRSTSKRKSAGD